MFVQYSAAGYERVKSSVFNLRLNTRRDGDDETKGGKLFQTRAAATGNARSPSSSVSMEDDYLQSKDFSNIVRQFAYCLVGRPITLERFDRGMTRAAVFDDRSRRRESVSATRVRQVRQFSAMLAAKIEHCQTVRYSLQNS